MAVRGKVYQRWRGVYVSCVFFFFQAEDGIRDLTVTGVQTCALPISADAFLAGSTGGSAQQRRYEADISTAGRGLEQAAEHNAAGGQSREELEAVIGDRKSVG